MIEFFRKMFGQAPNPYAGRTILVADDGELERKFMGAVLSKAGYRVLIANNGDLAFKMAKEFTPDLAILDFVMPEMNGRDACEKMKNDDRTKNIPVIFLTGSAVPTDVVNCYDVGAEYFLNKPISAGMLLKQITLTFQELEASQAA